MSSVTVTSFSKLQTQCSSSDQGQHLILGVFRAYLELRARLAQRGRPFSLLRLTVTLGSPVVRVCLKTCFNIQTSTYFWNDLLSGPLFPEDTLIFYFTEKDRTQWRCVSYTTNAQQTALPFLFSALKPLSPHSRALNLQPSFHLRKLHHWFPPSLSLKSQETQPLNPQHSILNSPFHLDLIFSIMKQAYLFFT